MLDIYLSHHIILHWLCAFPTMSSNPSFIQSLLIPSGISGMLSRVGCKIVSAAEVLLGAHVEVIVLGVVEYTFQALIGRHTDGTWRKSGVLVCIIR